MHSTPVVWPMEAESGTLSLGAKSGTHFYIQGHATPETIRIDVGGESLAWKTAAAYMVVF